jgi:prevent-host-death family protein
MDKNSSGFTKLGSLMLRQQFGAVLDKMRDGADPIIIEKNSTPIAVLMPYELFKQRFIELQSEEDKHQLLNKFLSAKKTYQKDTTSLIRDLRYGSKKQ